MKKLGYLITVFVSLRWLFILGGIERVQKAILLGVALYFANLIPIILISILTESDDPILIVLSIVLYIGTVVAHFWIWWHFYTKWVEEWKV